MTLEVKEKNNVVSELEARLDESAKQILTLEKGSEAVVGEKDEQLLAMIGKLRQFEEIIANNEENSKVVEKQRTGAEENIKELTEERSCLAQKIEDKVKEIEGKKQ